MAEDTDIDTEEYQKSTLREARKGPKQVKHRSQLAGRLLLLLVMFVFGMAMVVGMANTHQKLIFYETSATLEDVTSADEFVNITENPQYPQIPQITKTVVENVTKSVKIVD